MKLKFLGTGCADDSYKGHTSILVESETKLLLDCGPFSVQKLWQHEPDISYIDAIFISHRHGDHLFGLPFNIVHWKDCPRKKPLKVFTSSTNKEFVSKLFSLAYPLAEPTFPIEYIGVDDKSNIQLNELNLKFTYGKHSVEVMAIRVSDGKSSFCYAPDTNATTEIIKLAKDCDLLIHESFISDEKCVPEHASPRTAAQAAKEANVKKLALVHLHRDYAKQKEAALAEAKAIFENTVIPEDGDVIEL